MATASPSRPPVFNLPNQLTAARLVLALVLFCLIPLGWWITCIIIFALAAVTDWLDGYLARKQGLTSTLGRNLDPLVDKVLICGAYIFLLPLGMATEGGTGAWLQPWMVTLIVARELIITSLRSFLENRGVTFGADWLGKIKMVLQCAALVSIFVALYASTFNDLNDGARLFFDVTRNVLIWAMLIATALSGLQYLWRAGALIKMDRDL